nr:MAG TPA: hypothetical protein [Caudoviricetes sp.]
MLIHQKPYSTKPFLEVLLTSNITHTKKSPLVLPKGLVSRV